MKLIHQLHDLEELCREGACLCVGVFDGVHRGHQILLGNIREDAVKTGLPATVITFLQHPLTVLAPPYTPQLLTTADEKIRLFEKYGVDICCMLDFDTVFSETTAESFINGILLKICRIQSISCGIDFRFGSQGLGNLELLRKHSSEQGFRILECETLMENGIPVRSTRIRKDIMEGDFDSARLMLGHAYSFQGRIIEGNGRGQAIGYPTVNLAVHPEKLIPREGVYAVESEILAGNTRHNGRTKLSGMMNIGNRPTFDESGHTVEAHLFDFDGLKHDEQLCRGILT